MPNKDLVLAANWGAREEPVEQCAERIMQMLFEMSAFDKALATWYEQTLPRKRALARPVKTGNRDYFVDLLNGARHQRDSGESEIEEAGFTLGFWNGGSKEGTATIDIHCGSSSEWVGNFVMLNLPGELGALSRWEVMTRLLSAIATVWQAQTGRVSLTLVDAPAPNSEVTCRQYSWMIYYSHAERSQFPSLPDLARVVPVDPIGTIIVTQEEAPDAANPQHLDNIKRVEAAL